MKKIILACFVALFFSSFSVAEFEPIGDVLKRLQEHEKKMKKLREKRSSLRAQIRKHKKNIRRLEDVKQEREDLDDWCEEEQAKERKKMSDVQWQLDSIAPKTLPFIPTAKIILINLGLLAGGTLLYAVLDL